MTTPKREELVALVAQLRDAYGDRPYKGKWGQQAIAAFCADAADALSSLLSADQEPVDIWPQLADCINTELRENNGWGEQTREWGCDLRPYIRRLVDLTREAERFANRPQEAPEPVAQLAIDFLKRCEPALYQWSPSLWSEVQSFLEDSERGQPSHEPKGAR